MVWKWELVIAVKFKCEGIFIVWLFVTDGPSNTWQFITVPVSQFCHSSQRSTNKKIASNQPYAMLYRYVFKAVLKEPPLLLSIIDDGHLFQSLLIQVFGGRLTHRIKKTPTEKIVCRNEKCLDICGWYHKVNNCWKLKIRGFFYVSTFVSFLETEAILSL